MQSWSFGILCYNEEATVEQVYQAVDRLTAAWHLDDAEIILVDDGSRDATPEILRRLEKTDPRVRTILHVANQGIGAGIRDIYFTSTRENVVFIPGDGQFDVDELRPYPEFVDGTFLTFYRRENLTYSTFRNILSALNKWFNRFLLGLDLRDVNWVKVYKRHLVTNLDLRVRSSAVESEICAKLLLTGCLPYEIPSKYLPRLAGKSQGASVKSILRVLRDLASLFVAVILFRLRLRQEAQTRSS